MEKNPEESPTAFRVLHPLHPTLIVEWTQAVVAVVVVASVCYIAVSRSNATPGSLTDSVLVNMAFLIIGFYFSRASAAKDTAEGLSRVFKDAGGGGSGRKE